MLSLPTDTGSLEDTRALIHLDRRHSRTLARAPLLPRPPPRDLRLHTGQSRPPTSIHNRDNCNATKRKPHGAPPLACLVDAAHISSMVHNVLGVAPAKVVGAETVGLLDSGQMQ